MQYLNAQKIAEKWGISERSVRNYCAEGRVKDARLEGGVWYIPGDSEKPERINQNVPTLLDILRQENRAQQRGGIYHKVQIELTYNSNHIEGSRLTEEQTRYIFETNTIGLMQKFKGVRANDVVETANHFRCVDYIIDNANRQISEHMIKYLHLLLKNGTSDSREDWFNVGEYKKMPNEVGGMRTTMPEEVPAEMAKLIKKYRENDKKSVLSLKDLLEFHHGFELIHPFQDGNGRIGRLILFKECLRLDIVPFVIDEDLKMFYYRGLREWWKEPGFLIETCRAGQDKFISYLKYFQIEPGRRE